MSETYELPKMDVGVKERWLLALRGGEYKQGKGSLCILRDGEKSFCCLGVLTDLYMKEKGVDWNNPDPHANVTSLQFAVYGGENSYLPVKVMEWAGLLTNTVEKVVPERLMSARDIVVKAEDGTLTGLALMNDNDKTFEVIANAIERSL